MEDIELLTKNNTIESDFCDPDDGGSGCDPFFDGDCGPATDWGC